MEFYRYTFTNYAVLDGDGDFVIPNIPNVKVGLERYKLIRETMAGYWITYSGFDSKFKKWIPKQSKKRFAYPTKQEAMHNFIKRTEKRIRILKFQIDLCKSALSTAEIMSTREGLFLKTPAN